MQLNDIIALAKAGFTAEQIGALAQLPTDQPQPAPQAQPAPQPQTQPAPQPEPQQPAKDPLQAVLAELGILKGQIQQINVASAQQPQQPQPQELTGEQILANIISPPRQGGAN